MDCSFTVLFVSCSSPLFVGFNVLIHQHICIIWHSVWNKPLTLTHETSRIQKDEEFQLCTGCFKENFIGHNTVNSWFFQFSEKHEVQLCRCSYCSICIDFFRLILQRQTTFFKHFEFCSVFLWVNVTKLCDTYLDAVTWFFTTALYSILP